MPSELENAVAGIFVRCGMGEADARLLAHSLVKADQRGIHSHGTLRMPDYVDKLTIGGVDPKARPIIASDNGAALVIDARNAMGQIAADYAMKNASHSLLNGITTAIRKAAQIHVAVAAVRNSNHCGAMGHWAQMALPHDMIGLAATCPPWPPLAVAFPSGSEAPVITFGATAHGKIRVYYPKGPAIPEGWAFDAD